MTVTEPLANPTASCERSSRAVKAEIGNCLRPLWMERVDWHLGWPVFFSVLSSAHTFRSGSVDKSSEMVTSSGVPSTCFMCVIGADSWAGKDRTTLNACERIRTTPSELPRKTLSEPEHTQLMSLFCARQDKAQVAGWRAPQTSKTREFSASSGSLT